MTNRQEYWDFMRDGLTPRERYAREKAKRKENTVPEFEIKQEGKEYTWDIYLAGSLRNEAIPEISIDLASGTRWKVFSDWYAAGPEADDYWKEYYKTLGFGYKEALSKPASVHTFNFDKKHMMQSRVMVLALPAGKSGHLELGWFLGRGGPGFILLDGNTDRWDVMYQFATGVTDDVEELKNWIAGELL